MRPFYFWIVAFLLIIFSISCTVKETIRQRIPNNPTMPDTIVSGLLIENYINKVYINVLGRKASVAEFESAKKTLEKNNLLRSDRELFLSEIFRKPEYLSRMYDICRTNYLNNVDTSEISFQILVYEQYVRDNRNNPQLKDFLYLIENEIRRAKLFQKIPEELRNGNINVTEMQKRCVDNFIYDQINMGTQNFVLSVFENFCARYPTENERINAEAMVNGVATVIFLENGSSKNDFLSIFFNSKDYYEGQVNELMRRYLFRPATSMEMERLTKMFKTTKDYQKLQTEILVSNEYAGF